MKKSEKQFFVNMYAAKFIDPDKQYRDTPNMVFNEWIRWLYEMWEKGMIDIKEYRALIKIELNEFIGV